MKYVAIALNIDTKWGNSDPFFILDEGSVVKSFSNEKQVLMYIKKYYNPDTILIGLLDNPKPIYDKLLKAKEKHLQEISKVKNEKRRK